MSDVHDGDQPQTHADPRGGAHSGGAHSGDAKAAEGNHFGQDGGRDTVSVSAAQQEDDGSATQSVPAMSQNNAGADDKLSGILAQTRADMAGESAQRAAEVLRQRAEQAGVEVDEDEALRLVREFADG